MKLDSPSTSRKGAASISPRSQIAGYRTAFTGHKETKIARYQDQNLEENEIDDLRG